MLVLDLLEADPVSEPQLRSTLGDIAKVCRLDSVTVCQDNGSLDDIAQLPQVSRPGINLHRAHGIGSKSQRRFT